MKTYSPVLLLSLLLALPAFAGDAKSDCKCAKCSKVGKEQPTGCTAKCCKSTDKPKAKTTEKIALTGSYLESDVNRQGMITDGPYNVVVLDSEAIRNSGASDLRQVLVRRGLWR